MPLFTYFEGVLSDRPFNGISSRLFLQIEDRSEKGHGAKYSNTILVLRCAALAALRSMYLMYFT